MRRAVIKVIDTCQMRCIYCVNADGLDKLNKISLATIKGVLAKLKPKEVEFTGGEPSYDFKFLVQAIKEAKKYSSFIMINSNLELLDEEKIVELESVGLSHLHVAIHALDPQLHKIIRGNPNADINKVVKNIDFVLKQTSLKLIFEFVPMKVNLKELPKVYNYILGQRQKYGNRIVELEIGRLIPKGRATPKLAPSMEEEIKALKSLGKPQFLVELFCYDKTVLQRLLNSGLQVFPCDAGTEMFYFDTSGRIFADNFTGFLVSESYQDFDPTLARAKNSFVCPFRGY